MIILVLHFDELGKGVFNDQNHVIRFDNGSLDGFLFCVCP
jgi:hypothetical protein